MFECNKEVRVIKGYYCGQTGVITGKTVDGFLLITPQHRNGFWAKPDELELLQP